MTTREFNSSLLELRPKLHRFAMSLTSDRNKAPDLVQDTYLKALTSRDQFVDYTNFRAWVFTIMKNTFINNYRRDVKKNKIIDSTQDLYNLNQPAHAEYVSQESDFAEDEIEMTINSLGDDFKIPFRMHIDGYKYKEIADELGLKMGTVKSRIFLSRKKLMPKLKDFKR